MTGSGEQKGFFSNVLKGSTQLLRFIRGVFLLSVGLLKFT